MNVLVVNAGSSSLKYQLLDTDTREVFAKGNCERIGSEMGIFGHSENGGTKQTERSFPGSSPASLACSRSSRRPTLRLMALGIVRSGGSTSMIPRLSTTRLWQDS
ncbi:MAG: hypothetical protein ACLU37_03475 [Collinsella sp.]